MVANAKPNRHDPRCPGRQPPRCQTQRSPILSNDGALNLNYGTEERVGNWGDEDVVPRREPGNDQEKVKCPYTKSATVSNFRRIGTSNNHSIV